jgi:hypothetical protein
MMAGCVSTISLANFKLNLAARALLASSIKAGIATAPRRTVLRVGIAASPPLSGRYRQLPFGLRHRRARRIRSSVRDVGPGDLAQMGSRHT